MILKRLHKKVNLKECFGGRGVEPWNLKGFVQINIKLLLN